MANTTNTLDLGSLLGTDVSKNVTEGVLNSLILSMEELQATTKVNSTGNIFKCAISLGDFDFNLNLDLFDMTPTKVDYILLKKIQYLRRLITDINNIFINLIQDLECCTGDDRYNKTIVPIFKWLVEDKNGLCGSLLNISKNINQIYLPLKRVICLFRIVPGNPTIRVGYDMYSTLYPIIDGMEKVLNMLDNGRFLDLLIIPIKDFHDKLVACSNGKNADFYTGYHSLKDIISDSIYSELTANFIDSLKAIQETKITESTNYPTPPTPPEDNYGEPIPNRASYDSYEEFSRDLYQWNIGYTKYKRDAERVYDQEYATYLKELDEYKQTQFEKTLNINDDTFENSSLASEILVDDFKNKHRSICGCLGEIFRLDGLFIPKDKIIRTTKDLNQLIGEVKYKGMSISNYYTNEEHTLIDIINQGTLNTLVNDDKGSNFNETMKYPIVKSELLDLIDATTSIDDVINLNVKFNEQLDILKTKYRKASNYYDAVNNAFYSLYQKELNETRNTMNKFKVGATSNEAYEAARKKFYDYTEYPPASWLSSDKSLSNDQQVIFGNITYLNMVQGSEEINNLNTEIQNYTEAIGRNFAAFSIVDDANIECGCDLICRIIKYIINMILNVVKLLLNYIIKYLANAIMNKELMWWIKFIQSKIQCIVDLANLSKDLKDMQKRFDAEMKNAEGMIKKVPESMTSCTTTKSSVIDELNLYPQKAHVQPDSIKDITWTPTTYPDLGYDVYDGEGSDYDLTPTFNDSFKLDTNAPSLTNEWKNRTIPTLLLDCKNDHHTIVDWVPTTNNWKMFLNIKLNIDQFNDNPNIVLNGNIATTDEQLMAQTEASILYKILNVMVGQEDFWFKIEYNGSIFTFENSVSIRAKLTTEFLTLDEDTYTLEAISKVWFNVENDYFKVYDRTTKTRVTNYLEDAKEKLKVAMDAVKTKAVDYEVPESTNNKICSASSLRVTTFEQVFLDETSILYPGKLVKFEDADGNITFRFTPRTYKIAKTNPDGTSYEDIEYFTKNNVPFKIVLTNSSGTTFTVVALIDICVPNNVIKTSYYKEVDGVFLNGRYDYFEFDSIPNNSVYSITEKNVIAKLKKYLENIGAISTSLVGPTSISGGGEKVNELISNAESDNTYSEGFKTDQDTSNSNAVLGNLPNNVKNEISKYQSLFDAYTLGLENIEELHQEIKNGYVSGENLNVPVPENILNKSNSILGIPIAVLNEDEKIILTIHNKRLQLININNNFALNIPLVTDEIDYLPGEQLFIEFSTTGFTHTISWTNERKVTSSATIMSTNSLTLKPTQLGSYYKNGTKVALMCGMLLDIIFTESNKDRTDWMNNSNTYRPTGTIGYYDFSVFDGYHVYSIPEFFKVTKISELATLKGILYESKEFTREEILIKIQNGELNKLLSNDVTIVGDKPISVGGDFIWKNKTYYKNVTFGYLDNFFCRDNLSDSSFTISFWLKMKDSISNGREDFTKKYIFSDTHNGNFIWWEDGLIKLQFFGQPLRTEPVHLLFKKDITVPVPEYVEKWFHHVFSYDKANATINYTIEAIDKTRKFDINYNDLVLEKVNIKIPLINNSKIGKKIKFSLVTMLARYDVKSLKYTDMFDAEIAALAIWKEYKDTTFTNSLFDYQKRIIINEMD